MSELKPYVVIVHEGLTDNFHSGGAALVLAADESDARRQVAEGRLEAMGPYAKLITEDDFDDLTFGTVEPWDGSMRTFPYSGCCG